MVKTTDFEFEDVSSSLAELPFCFFIYVFQPVLWYMFLLCAFFCPIAGRNPFRRSVFFLLLLKFLFSSVARLYLCYSYPVR